MYNLNNTIKPYNMFHPLAIVRYCTCTFNLHALFPTLASVYIVGVFRAVSHLHIRAMPSVCLVLVSVLKY
jgi:hypothetical protein